jgi:ABC-2 type transport system ATP-binding protein
LIATTGLTKRYPGGITALDGLTVEIEPGIVGLVGSNGAGKSTLLKILLGLLEPTSGGATIFDLPVATRGIEIRELIGYMPEHDCLPPDMTATDIVSHLALISGLPKAAARERTAEVLRHVGLYEERYRAIGGYSTGMKQRVKLAQALVHDPRLLLLDEPTNGLDPGGIRDMRALIKELAERGMTIFLSSHLLAEVEELCTRVSVIRAGAIVYEGSLAELHASASPRYRLRTSDQDMTEAILIGDSRVHEPTRDGDELVFDADEATVLELSRALAAAGIGIAALVPETATLERLFFELTEGEPHPHRLEAVA